MLRCNCSRWSVEPSEYDTAVELSRAHVVQLGSAVDDVVDGLQRKVHGHELDDRREAHQRSPAADSSEAGLGDGRVPQALRTPLVDEPLRDLVGSVVVGHFLTHDEYFIASGELLVERLVQSLTDGDLVREIAGQDAGDALNHLSIISR